MTARRPRPSLPRGVAAALAALALIPLAGAIARPDDRLRPTVVRAAAAPFRVELSLATRLPPGTRLDAALSFGGRALHGSWRAVEVARDGKVALTFADARSARHGLYAVVLVLDLERQPLETRDRIDRPARWEVPVYIGEPETELAGIEDERRLLAEAFEIAGVLVADLGALDAASDRDAALASLRWELRRVEELVEPLDAKALLAPHHPDAVDDLGAIASLVDGLLAAETRGERPPVSAKAIAAEHAGRVDALRRRGVLEDGDAERALEQVALLAETLVRDAAPLVDRTRAGTKSERLGPDAVDPDELDRQLRRAELLAADLRRRAEALADDGPEGTARLRELATLHRRIVSIVAGRLRTIAGLDPGADAPRAEHGELDALVGRRDGAADAVARVLEQKREALARTLTGELERLLARRRAWEELIGDVDGAEALARWRVEASAEHDRLAALRVADDPLERLGAARLLELAASTLVRRDRLRTVAAADPARAGDPRERRLLETVLDRTVAQLRALASGGPRDRDGR